MSCCAVQTEAKKVDGMALIEATYPEKDGFKRRITPLWGQYYRINYIDTVTGLIPTSYFLEVLDTGDILNHDKKS